MMHATCISLQGKGILLTGASGCGKSDLALRCIEQLGATLVADDQVELTAHKTLADKTLADKTPAGKITVLASPPPTLQGKLEVRGVGIITQPWAKKVPVALVLRLQPKAGCVPRLPKITTTPVAGVGVPTLPLSPFNASACLKLRLALTMVQR